ncbi:MAG: conjugal transfer protein TraF, partial [Spirochaetales bacterium]|nr:conjugal transfer protein TraF [Spirochaetales bacterium]
MKKMIRISLLLLTVVIAAAGIAAAEEKTDDSLLRFSDPVMMSMGGTEVTAAYGYNALFTNPAGIARKNELNLLSLSPTVYVHPSEELAKEVLEILNNGSGDIEDFEPVLEYIEFDNGIGTNFSLGSGLALAGFGLGVRIDAEALLDQTGSSLLTVETKPDITSSAVFGFSHGFTMGPGKLYTGADIRGIARFTPKQYFDSQEIETLMDDDDAADNIELQLSIGLGYDAGFIYEMDLFSIGVAAKNIMGTQMTNYDQTVGGVSALLDDFDPSLDGMNALLDGLQESPSADAEASYIPMSLVFGLGFEHDLGSLLGVRLGAEYEKIFYQEDENLEQDTFWKNV